MAGAGGALLQPDDLGGAAADIEHQRAPVFAANQRGTAFRGKFGFLFRADHAQLQPRLVPDAPHQHIGIAGQARRLGGDRPHMVDFVFGDAIRTDFQGGNRAVDGGVGEQAGAADPLAQADNAGEGIHDPGSWPLAACLTI